MMSVSESRLQPPFDPNTWDWSLIANNRPLEASVADSLARIGDNDCRRDAEELRWLLEGIQRELAYFNAIYPDAPFERELAAAFSRQVDTLDRRASSMIEQPAEATWDAYLTLKYEIRKLYKQLGGIVSGSDWQTPGKQSHGGRQALTDEAGFAQEEEGTYQRCYGSEAVKEYEAAAMRAFYNIPEGLMSQSSLFLTTSGMKALELAIAAFRSFSGQRLPCVVQAGFYGEGVELAQTLLDDVRQAEPDEIYRMLETSQAIGCLIVDPGQCWPIKPPVDLDKLFDRLRHHRPGGNELLFVIVDRTLTSISNQMFRRYADSLPPHVILVSVESGIKYLQYGFDLTNVGYLVACGQAMEEPTHRSRWVDLLSILDAGASPIDVRQLPAPDFPTVEARLGRLNRNAHWMNAYLRYLREQGRIKDYFLSVNASEDYVLDGRPWIGTVFYIRLYGELSEQDYQARIDACARAVPSSMHLISGGSFGFDSLRLNAVHGETAEENALRLSAGRAPLDQLMETMRVLAELLFPAPAGSCA